MYMYMHVHIVTFPSLVRIWLALYPSLHRVEGLGTSLGFDLRSEAASVAQLVEHLHDMQCVSGSSPA